MTLRLRSTLTSAAIGLLGMSTCMGWAGSIGLAVLGQVPPPSTAESPPAVAAAAQETQSPATATPRPDGAGKPEVQARPAGPARGSAGEAGADRPPAEAVHRRNRFALALYRRLAESSTSSLFICPSGVYEALEILAPGARGETARQIESILEMNPAGRPTAPPGPNGAASPPRPATHPAGPLPDRPAGASRSGAPVPGGDSDRVATSAPIPTPTSQPAPARAATEPASAADKNPDNPPVRGAQLLSANALWLQAGLTFAPEYREIAEKRHSAMLAQADFLANAQQARRTINAWVAGQTGQMVKELLSSDMVDSTTRLLLTNAVCFRAAWIRPFDVANTEDHPFRVSDTLQVPVPMMNQVGVFPLLEADGLQIVELPYDGGAFSMVIIVPRLGALRGLESQLAEPALTSYLKGLTPTRLDLSVPRFKLGSREDLRDPLKALGMLLAFTNRADFTGLCRTDRGLKVSALIHESAVEVTEAGTVAASATGASLIEKGFEIGVRRFKADRPFLFLILDKGGGTIVFMGRYSGPSH